MLQGSLGLANKQDGPDYSKMEPLTFKELFFLSQKCYNRLIAGFFERKKTYNKLALTLVCLSQYFVLMLLSMMCWHVELFIIVFMLMRVYQLIIQFVIPPIKGTEPHFIQKTKSFSMIGIFVGIIFILLTHIVVAMVDQAMQKDPRMGSWGELFLVSFIFELIWDFALVHIFVLQLFKKGCKPGG